MMKATYTNSFAPPSNTVKAVFANDTAHGFHFRAQRPQIHIVDLMTHRVSKHRVKTERLDQAGLTP